MAWAALKVSARLMIDDVEYECVRAGVAYELNAVPRAVFLVAVGRGRASLTPAQIHRSSFSTQASVKFYLRLQQLAGEPQNLPGDEFLLFEGYLTGVNYQRSRDKAHAVLHARHWLLDMDYSSALSESSHPLNPSQFTYRPIHSLAGASESWTPFLSQGLITPEVITSDFWGAGLKLWLEEITKEDLINVDELPFLGSGGGSNASAAKALARFSTGAGNYVPLAIDLKSADADSVAAAIWNDVQMETYDAFANTTLWNKLVSDFGSRYLFAVVPRVNDAIVIPYVPGLRTTWNYELAGKDYALLGATSELMRVLRGVGVFTGLKSRTGADLREPGQEPTRLGIGGWFSPPDIQDGTVLLRQGPRWLTNIIATDRYSEFSTGAGATEIGTAMHPAVGSPGSLKTPVELRQTSKRLIDAFAESLYVYEQLRMRQMELSGKARFDIAPGSTVKVEIPGDKFISGDSLQQHVLGDVLRVTYLIDSEASKISADFHLAHVRTVAENKRAGFSTDRHPLWQTPWPGAGLLEYYDG